MPPTTGNATGAPPKEGKLPLADDFFKAPPLNAKETKYLVNLAKRACKEVVYYSRRTGGPMNWVHLSSDDGVEVFQGIDETASADAPTRSITYLRGSTRIYATIDDIADFFRLDTPMKLSGFTQTVGKDLLDQKTLYDLALPTEENPKHYVGVKWTAVESPSKLARNRDLCYLECHDEFIDTNSKKRGWVRSLHSIRLPFCPPLDKSHGLVRASLYRSGFVFIESDDKSYVDAVHTLHMDIKGSAPNWLKILVMKRRIKNISEVNRYFQMRRLCEGRLLGDLELPSKSGVAKCQICSHKFGLFSRKSTCRKCGKVICSNCGHHFILDYAGTGAKKVKICTHCSDKVVHGMSEDVSDRSVSHLRAHRVDSIARPLYDQSPSSADSRPLKHRQLSQEEQDYYMQNEDDRGRADILEAKRMHREFEEHFSRSGASVNMRDTTPAMTKPPIAPHRHLPVETYDNHSDDGDFRMGRSRDQRNSLNMSTYQEFMRQERSRQMSRTGVSAPSAAASRPPQFRNTINRSSMPHAVPEPGETLSRARLNHSFDHPASNYSPAQHPEDTLDSIRISSDWDNDYLYHVSAHQMRDNASVYTDETVGAPIRRSDLSLDSRPSRERASVSDGFRSSFLGHDGYTDELSMPRHLPPPYPVPPSSDAYSDRHRAGQYRRQTHGGIYGRAPESDDGHGYGFDNFRRSYFDARNSDIHELEQRMLEQSITDDEGDFRYGYDAASAQSDDTEFFDQEYDVSTPADGPRDQKSIATEKQKNRDAAEELATVMALSAMRLYEKENGLGMQVSEETRQAALKKMVEIYTSEIERTSMEEMPPRVTRPKSRSISEGAYGSNGPRTSNGVSDMSASRPDRQHAQTMLEPPPQSSDHYMEYRDLSDLSASAFKAFQKKTHQGSLSSQPRSDAEPSLRSSAVEASRRPPSGAESKSSSRRNAPLGLSDTDNRSRGAGTTIGSQLGSDSVVRPSPRAISIRDDISDTFSELDLIDLPHLMRADDSTAQSRGPDRLSQESQQTTFSELSEWQESSGRNSLSTGAMDLHTNETHRFGDEEWVSTAVNNYSVDTSASPPQTKAQDQQSRETRSSSVISDDSDYHEDLDDGDLTSRTKMTMSELERYRASLAELMAEYNEQNSPPTMPGRQPEPEGMLRKVIRRPERERSSASLSIGLTWPKAGKGNIRT